MSETKRRGNPNWTKGGPSPNPKGRTRTDKALVSQTTRTDGWYSLLTGLGSTTHDKRSDVTFWADVVTWDRAQELWRGDDLAARIVETLPNEMVREGFEFCVTDDAEGNDKEYGVELTEKVRTKWNDLGVVEAVHKALCFERAYGGAALWPGAIDGADTLAAPLGKKLQSFDFINVLEPRELTPHSWYSDPLAPKFGQVEVYQLTPLITGTPKSGTKLMSSVLIHESRLIVFPGIKVANQQLRGTYAHWGDSVFTRVFRVLADFNVSWGAAGILVSDFAQPVFKMENLAQIMEQDNKDLFQARMAAIALSMSTARAVLIDKNEEYARQQTPVTGLPELLELFCKRLAAAADIPVSILFGESPGGINASGASGDQMRIFYDRVKAMTSRKCLPAMRRITQLILMLLGGEPASWDVKACPLWQVSEKEAADTEAVRAATLKAFWEIGAISTEEIRRSPGFADQYALTLEEKSDDPEMPDANAVAEFVATAGQPAATGAEPTETVAPEGSTDIQKEALNGAQVTSLVEVVTAVATKQISRQSGQRVLMLAFQIPESEALLLLGPEDFEPSSAVPAPALPGAPSPEPPKEPPPTPGA